MSSIFRKAIWPAIMAVFAIVALGAFGNGSGVTPVSAAFATGDICTVAGPTLIKTSPSSAKLTYLFWARVQDSNGSTTQGSTSTNTIFADLDNTAGDVNIVSWADDEGDSPVPAGTDDAEISIAPANTFGSIDVAVPNNGAGSGEWTDAFLNNIAAAHAQGQPAASNFPGASVPDLDPNCGITTAGGFTDGLALVDIWCQRAGDYELSFFDTDPSDGLTTAFTCLAPPTKGTMTLVPGRVQIVPSDGDVSHSLVIAVYTDAAGNAAFPGDDVDFFVDHGCRVDTSAVDTAAELTIVNGMFSIFNPNYPGTGQAIENTFQPGGPGAHNPFAPPWATNAFTFQWVPPGPPGTLAITVAAAIVHCDFATAVPGVATVTSSLDKVPGADIILTAPLTVVGPPANIVVVVDNASPVCSGRVTVTAKITDSIGQNVSDHTLAEAITTLGGVLAGNGAVAAQAGLVTPISSTVGETFSGVVTFFLLLSDTQSTHYEIVVTSGGGGEVGDSHDDFDHGFLDQFGLLGGIFSTPPVSGYASVDCKAPGAPVVVGPNTGTGPLRAPNTGDAGLASTSGGSSLVLFGIAAAAVFALMGLGALKAVRR